MFDAKSMMRGGKNESSLSTQSLDSTTRFCSVQFLWLRHLYPTEKRFLYRFGASNRRRFTRKDLGKVEGHPRQWRDPC